MYFVMMENPIFNIVIFVRTFEREFGNHYFIWWFDL